MEGRFQQLLANGGDGGMLDPLSYKKPLLNPQGGLNIKDKQDFAKQKKQRNAERSELWACVFRNLPGV